MVVEVAAELDEKDDQLFKEKTQEGCQAVECLLWTGGGLCGHMQQTPLESSGLIHGGRGLRQDNQL